ncbi:uncharacterized protein [Rutidosis leptorrhynchoides]|uniref:uncharacterized protein n=1 Tax=Rutidosis leptorrhynchoides TaxID=125765 RepID=UPI003A99A441
MAESVNFHHAITVTNIKSTIPENFDMDTNKYLSWVTLFKTHSGAYQVRDYIISKTATTDSSSTTVTNSSTQPVSKDLWDRLDTFVLQWISGTISIDMLGNILKPDQTALDVWNRVKFIFEDNKNSRAVYLRHKFTNIRLDNYPNVIAYCKV